MLLAPPETSEVIGGRGSGLAVALAIAAVATLVATRLSVVGAPVIAIVLGLVVAAVGAPASWKAGTELAAKRVLQAAIVVLGLDLSVRQVLVTGWSSLPVLLGTLAAALAAAAVVGRLLGLRWDLKVLIGVGTAICGASAIAATDAVIDADEVDVAYAVATIFAFNIVAVLSYPALGHLMGLSQHAFGLWAGTAINDTSSVVAAATNYGSVATSYAVVVKLTRTLAIIPISLVLAAWAARRRAAPRALAATAPGSGAGAGAGGTAIAAGGTAIAGGAGGAAIAAEAAAGATTIAAGAGGTPTVTPLPPSHMPLDPRSSLPLGSSSLPLARTSSLATMRRAVPSFLALFLVAVACNSAGLVPASARGHLAGLATFLVTTALAGIGCSARLRQMRRVGIRPILFGAALWAVVCLTSLALQAVTGTL
ncbi:MAG TPA: putative sulfate exporter family transporter [Acidimicrobiales bacterium]|nr:putative sulfate exporter family transporter [Acidimicrobiales bacterium]